MGIFSNNPRPRPPFSAPRPVPKKAPGFFSMMLGPTPKKNVSASRPAGLFGDKKPLSRQNLRNVLRKDSGRIPKTMRKFSFKEREGMEKTVFGYKKYGSHISERDYKGAIGDLERNRAVSKSYSERKKIQDTISYLKGLDKPEK